MDAQISDCILTDHEYKGTCFQVLKKKAVAKTQKVQSAVAEAVRENCHNTATSWTKVTYNGIVRFLTIAISYIDLSLDSILLTTVVIALGPTIGNYKRVLLP